LVRRGEVVTAGRPIGTLGAAAGHAGLHLGVRRSGERFGYVDPLRFLGTSPPAAPPIPRAGPRPAPPPAAPRADPLAAPHAGPVPRGHPVPGAGPWPAVTPLVEPRHTVPVGVRVFVPAGARGLAPWPAWAGLALLLLGAAGGGVRIGARRRRVRVRAAVPSAP
jgi:pyruvate/2-oxoglutarate dehydrogenase complex dihydrolipoamide acyltransferase (E2) component